MSSRACGANCAQLVEVDAEPGRRLVVAVRQRPAAEVLDLALVDRVAGIRVEHAVARVHQRLDELGDHRLAAGLHDDVGRTELDAAVAADVVGERLAQRGDPRRRAVAGLAVGDRLGSWPRRCSPGVGRLMSPRWNGYTRLPRGGPLGRRRRHGERRLGAEPVESFCEIHALFPIVA